MSTKENYQVGETTKQLLIVIGFFTAIALITYIFFSL
jgi:hypothetical protein